MVDIGAATAADTGSISRVLIRSITALCAADHSNDPGAIASWTANKTEDNITKWLAAPGVTVLVARGNDGVCAVGCYTAKGDILLNYVSPDARFQGVSSTMLSAMEAALLAKGHDIASLDSTLTALRFYQARGWITSGGKRDKFDLTAIPMTKKLTG